MARKRKHPVSSAAALPLGLPPCKDFLDSESAMSSPDSQGSSSCRQEKTPVVRSAANARERSRMRVLSKAFSRLKTTLPWVPADTKLSKLDTLRLAACYISHLRDILAEDRTEQKLNSENKVSSSSSSSSTSVSSKGGKSSCGHNKSSNASSANPPPIHPLNLTWPFTFNGRSPATGGPVFPGTKESSLQQHPPLST